MKTTKVIMKPITLFTPAVWLMSPAQSRYLVSLEIDLLQNYIIAQEPPIPEPKEKPIEVPKHRPMPFWANNWRKKC